MPRIMPEPSYFSMPSIDVGAEVLRNRAFKLLAVRNGRSSIAPRRHPFAGGNRRRMATTVTRSRCPRAFARRTQKPFSVLWKVTRSTKPARTSCVDDCGGDFMRFA